MSEREVVYLVKIDKNEVDKSDLGYMFSQTHAYSLFRGKLVNHAAGKMWFELNNKEKTLVCVPVKWIEWMAEAKPEKEKKEKEDRE